MTELLAHFAKEVSSIGTMQGDICAKDTPTMKSFFAFAFAAVAFADEAADKSADATAKSTAAG